jgi:hypothetical protein
VPRLAPGMIAAAFHGLLRTAHAYRALQARDNPARRHELARGLAYWAARYEELPGPPALSGTLDLPEAYEALPVLGDDAPGAHLITERVRGVAEIAPAFEAGVVALHPSIDPALAVERLAAVGATAYLRNAETGHPVALVHAVTGPMALQLLLPALGQPERETAFAYLWQAAAAIFVAFADDRRAVDPTELLSDLPYPEEVEVAALESGDEHAIKLAEAALRAYQLTGEPALVAAAADAAVRLAH